MSIKIIVTGGTFDKEYNESEFYYKGKGKIIEGLDKGLFEKGDDGEIIAKLNENSTGWILFNKHGKFSIEIKRLRKEKMELVDICFNLDKNNPKFDDLMVKIRKLNDKIINLSSDK